MTLFLAKLNGVGRSESACPVQCREEPSHITELHQFFHEPAGRDEARVSLVPKKPVRYRTLFREELSRGVGVDDQAHGQTPSRSRSSFRKNWR